MDDICGINEVVKVWVAEAVARYGLDRVKAALKEYEEANKLYDKYKDGEKT